MEKHHGGVAQLGEHLPCKQGVRSSILLISTNRQAGTLFFENCIEEETKEKISRKRKIFWRTEGNPERGNPFPGEKKQRSR
jgi:hypothetical protein